MAEMVGKGETKKERAKAKIEGPGTNVDACLGTCLAEQKVSAR